MSRNFLTSINLNKNQLLNAAIQSLSTAPSSPVAGQIYFDTDTKQLTLWDSTAWVSLAVGGTLEEAIDALTTDDIEEGTTNLYFTDSRALTATASAYDAAGAASTVAGDLTTHISDTTTHGVVGDIVGTSDSQSLSNKTIAGGLLFGTNTSEISDADGTLEVYASQTLNLISNSGDIVLNADGSVYKNSNSAGNELVTQTVLNSFIGDNTVTGATGDTITDRITTAASGALSDAQAYADGLVQGLNVKDSVRVASSTDIDIANATEIDGVTLASGDRVLLYGQSTAAENGIYVFTTSLARAEDQATVDKGDYVLVTNGTHAATGWIATSATAWTQFSAANEYTAGDGIDITTNAISVALDGASLSVSSSGLRAQVAEGGGLNIDATYGLYAQLGDGLITDTMTGDIVFDTANGYGVRKYSAANTALTATSGSVSWTVTHNLGTRNVTVQVFDLATYEQVEVDVARTSTSVVTLSWVSEDVSADAYQVVVVG